MQSLISSTSCIYLNKNITRHDFHAQLGGITKGWTFSQQHEVEYKVDASIQKDRRITPLKTLGGRIHVRWCMNTFSSSNLRRIQMHTALIPDGDCMFLWWAAKADAGVWMLLLMLEIHLSRPGGCRYRRFLSFSSEKTDVEQLGCGLLTLGEQPHVSSIADMSRRQTNLICLSLLLSCENDYTWNLVFFPLIQSTHGLWSSSK